MNKWNNRLKYHSCSEIHNNHENRCDKINEIFKSAHGAHLDFTGEARQVEGELELGVGELAAAGVGGV